MEHEALLAHEQIRDALARYNHSGDRGRLAELADCFCQDGVLEIAGEPPLRGRAAIESRLARVVDRVGGKTRPGLVRHHVSSIRIELEGSDAARVWSYFLVLTEIGLDHWGRYVDRFRRSDGGWRIAHRRVVIEGAAAETRMARAYLSREA